MHNSSKFIVFQVFVSIAFIVLLGRFYYVQILESDLYLQASERNRIRHISIEPTRGLILDRNGKILVDNKPSYSVYAIPNEIQNLGYTFEMLAKILDKKPSDLQRLYKRRRRGPFQRIKLARDIGFDKLAWLEEKRLDLPGIVTDTTPRRFYPSKVLAPHLFGYISEISERELKKYDDGEYESGDVIGIKGIEKVYEKHLRGEDGYRFVEVDARGKEVKVLKELGGKQPRPGKDVVLSIDSPLQEYLEMEMMGKRGGAVVLNCKNGQVIALVSKPDYDPEIFTRRIPQDVWDTLNDRETRPLYDRMIQGLYPPGSTYKIVSVIAGLETKAFDPEQGIFCRGYFRLGVGRFGCWKKGGHGMVNLRQSVEQSCNVYFYRTISKIGLAEWVRFSSLFRFGKKTGTDLYGESRGLLPDQAYLDRRFGKGKWSRGLLLNLTIGQGDLLATPLQMAFFAMSVANKGRSFRPYIGMRIIDPALESNNIQEILPDTVRIEGISDETWQFVHESMKDVVHGVKGTAKAANPGQIHVAGKTGTAQAPSGNDHAWFIGFAPVEDPQVAFAILLENGGGGGRNSAPIAGGLLKLLLKSGKINIPQRFAAAK